MIKFRIMSNFVFGVIAGIVFMALVSWNRDN